MSRATGSAKRTGMRGAVRLPEGQMRAAISILSTAGIAISAYLTYSHFAGATLFCPAGSGCDIVQKSEYATIFEVPVALVGLVGFGAILALTLGWVRIRNKGLALYLLALAGFVFASYLTLLELFVIRAVCPYCVATYGIIAAILALLLASQSASWWLPLQRHRALSLGVVAAVLAASVLFQWNSVEAPSDDTNSYAEALARHLTDSGVAMYGAYWCPACNAQKALFGEAFKYVNNVECDPRGKDGNPLLCTAKGIQAYPTWEINGQMLVGVQSLEELARLTGFTTTSPSPFNP